MAHLHTDDMDNDDRPVGRVLSRRETLALFGMSATALLAACSTGGAATAIGATATGTAQSGATQPASAATRAPGGSTATTGSATARGAEAATAANPTTLASQVAAVGTAAAASTGTTSGCVVRPEMTEGPYFVDEKLNRSDIRSDPSDNSVRPGIPLALAFSVQSVTGAACTPLAGATVDIWHCDAQGSYSDVQSANTAGKKFLRGSQTTDASGAAKFTTIYPGWYQGRAVHIHFKIRTTNPAGQAYEFTSQLFFDDALSDQVYALVPYASRGKRDTTNARDGIFRNGGDQMLLAPTKAGDGYTATFAVGLDLANASVGQPDGAGRPGGGGPGAPGGLPPGRGTGTPAG